MFASSKWRTVWGNYVREQCRSAMRIGTALVESAFSLRRVTGERETCWRKRGRSLVSDKSVYHKSVLQECLTRVSHRSVRQECPIKVSYKSVLRECSTRVSYKTEE